MDFPVFHLDFMGNRMLIAVIAIVHVIINHAMAVGLMPLVTILEYRGSYGAWPIMFTTNWLSKINIETMMIYLEYELVWIIVN